MDELDRPTKSADDEESRTKDTPPTDSDVASPSGAADLGIDLEGLNLSLGLTGAAGRIGSKTTAGDEVLDELAEDMGEVRNSLRQILEQQQGLGTRMARLETTFNDLLKRQSRQIAKVRRDLIEEHRSLVASASFQAVNATREGLAVMLDGLRSKKDTRTRRQLEAILSTLQTLIQSLGFREFHAMEGEAFNPDRMECVGYAEGRPSTVLKAVRAGYEAEGKIFRAAGVIIAAPASSTASHPDSTTPSMEENSCTKS